MKATDFFQTELNRSFLRLETGEIKSGRELYDHYAAKTFGSITWHAHRDQQLIVTAGMHEAHVYLPLDGRDETPKHFATLAVTIADHDLGLLRRLLPHLTDAGKGHLADLYQFARKVQLEVDAFGDDAASFLEDHDPVLYQEVMR